MTKNWPLRISALLLALMPVAVTAHPVLMISIDGLRPADVLEAHERGLNLPNLTAFLTTGSYARGVVGVLPTLTYPSHTTLITGVSPAKHGIVANNTFDPMNINDGGWYWYAEDDKAETLWDAAFRARLTTGNVHWPVSVGAPHITWNLPQIWRTGHPDDRKLVRALATPGLVAEMEAARREGYADGKDESLVGDKLRAGFAQSLIRHHQPGFLTVYLAALDHQEHMTGPGSPEANRTLETIDGLVGEIVAIERQFHPDADIAVVSDHGFAPIDTAINLYRPFIDAGLVTIGAGGKITGWEATPMVDRRIVCDRAGPSRRRRLARQSRRLARSVGARSRRAYRTSDHRARNRGDGRQSARRVLCKPENRRRRRAVHRGGPAADPAIERLQGHARLFPRRARNAIDVHDRGPRHRQGARSG